MVFFFFFFKQKTAYEMRISDWSSDVCSSDLDDVGQAPKHQSAENGGKTDQTYAEGASHVIKTVIHKHGDAVRAQQIHAVATSEQTKGDLPERSREIGGAHV